MIGQILRRSFCAEILPIARRTRPRAVHRSPSVRAASLGSPAVGGWSFAFDPDLNAAAAPALWRPRACAYVTIARPGPKRYAALRLAEMTEGTCVAAEVLGHRDWHLVLAAGGRRHRIAVRRCIANERLAFLTPADTHAELRAAMAISLLRELLGLGAASPPAGGSPGPSEHWRLVQWLRLLDALAEGASPRDTAAALFCPDAASFSAAEWDASSERRRIARWRRAALAMRDGGYRRLLAAA